MAIGALPGLAGCLGQDDESGGGAPEDKSPQEDAGQEASAVSGSDSGATESDDSQASAGRAITGTVVSADPDEGGIQGVSVTLLDTEYATRTDDSGAFSLTGLDDRLYDLRVEKAGYQTVTDVVAAERGNVGEIYLLAQDDIRAATPLGESEVDSLFDGNERVSDTVAELERRGFEITGADRLEGSDGRIGVVLLFEGDGGELRIVSDLPAADLPLVRVAVSDTGIELRQGFETPTVRIAGGQMTVWHGGGSTTVPIPRLGLFGGVQPELHNAPQEASRHRPSPPPGSFSFLARNYGPEKHTADLADHFEAAAENTGCQSPDKPALGEEPSRRTKELVTEHLCRAGVLERNREDRRLWSTVLRTLRSVSDEVAQEPPRGLAKTAAISVLGWLAWDLARIADDAAEAACRAARTHRREIENELHISSLDTDRQTAVREHAAALDERIDGCVVDGHLAHESTDE